MTSKNSIENRHTTLLLRSAIASRLILIALIILWRSFLSPYDTSASINPNCLLDSNNQNLILFPRVASAIEDTIVWDSVYFVRIAQCGYEYEQSYAFLPLLPICISFLSRTVFAPLVPLIGYRAVLAVSGYVLNNIAFLFAALYLYKLSLIVLKDSEAAFRASILFCFNPASIFYSSIYSESLYALLSIGGIFHLLSGKNNYATIWLALSGSARSNGVLNAGYICFQIMHQAYDALFIKNRSYLAAQVLTLGALRSIFIFVPFIAFQAYGYYNICFGRSVEESRPWCKAKIPLLYNFIQSHYWGVGFLKYFKIKQLPNFVLAFPILSLSICSIIYYAKLQKEVFLSLGFRASAADKKSASVLFYAEKEITKSHQDDGILRRRKRGDVRGEQGYLSVFILPFIFHLGFMSATAFFVMHVQVSTRFLSSSPPLYWFAASYLMVTSKRNISWCGYLVWSYCGAYILLGSILFSNFYPFT